MDTSPTGRISGMQTRTSRRELTFVMGVALAGLTLVMLVAFTPWYESVMLG